MAQRMVKARVTGEGIKPFEIDVPEWDDISEACEALGDDVALDAVIALTRQKLTNAARVSAQEVYRAKQKAAMKDPEVLALLRAKGLA